MNCDRQCCEGVEMYVYLASWIWIDGDSSREFASLRPALKAGTSMNDAVKPGTGS